MVTVVTGAAGHVGANLVRALLAQGRPVRALVRRDRRALDGLAVECVQGDVCDPASLARAFAGANVVFHTAGHISIVGSEWRRLEAVNVAGTRHVVEACLSSGVRRLVHFSSIHALEQGPLDVPVNEDRPLVCGRCPPYDRSKAAGEREVRKGIAQGLNAVILYPTSIIGPHDYKPSLQGQMLLALAERKLPALVAGGFDWVDVRDVVEAALHAAERARAGARYLLAGHWVTMSELACMAQEITGVPAPRLICPMGLARIAAPGATALAQISGIRPLFTGISLRALRGNRQISAARAEGDLGYQPRPLRDTLADTYRWFVDSGRLRLTLD